MTAAATALLAFLATGPFDTAPSRDLPRFPAPDLVREQIDFARRHLGSLDQRIAVEGWRSESLWSWRQEAYDLWYTWDCLAYAQIEGVGEASRRFWLRILKGRLPPEDWAAGRMPPHVPYWRFEGYP